MKNYNIEELELLIQEAKEKNLNKISEDFLSQAEAQMTEYEIAKEEIEREIERIKLDAKVINISINIDLNDEDNQDIRVIEKYKFEQL